MRQNMAAATTELWPSIANTVMVPWRGSTSPLPRRFPSSKDNVEQSVARTKVAEPQHVSRSLGRVLMSLS